MNNDTKNGSNGSVHGNNNREKLVGKLSLSRLSEDKIEEIIYRLSRQVGAIVRESGLLVFCSKSKTYEVISIKPDPSKQLFIFVLTDLVRDLHDFRVMIDKFETRLGTMFSPAELGLNILCDFIAGYFKDQLYVNDERARALEVAVAEFKRESLSSKDTDLSVGIIDFKGEYKTLHDGKLGVLGCPDEEMEGMFIDQWRKACGTDIEMTPKIAERTFKKVVKAMESKTVENEEDGWVFEGTYNRGEVVLKKF